MIKTWISYKSSRVFSTLAISLLLVGCSLPEFEGEDPNALVEVTANKIDEAYAPELNQVVLNQIKVGDMVKYETTYVAENGGLNAFEDRKRTVKKVDWDSNPAVVVMDYERIDRVDNSKSFFRDEIWQFENSDIQTLAARALQSFFPFNDEPVLELKYYNLKTQRRVVTPPDTILNKENCGGLVGCVIRGIEVSYIVHLVKDGEIVERQERREFVSHQIPPLFVVDTQDPYGTLYPVAQSCNKFLFEGTLVNMCTTISDVDIK